MRTALRTTASAALIALLAACGGGNNDDPQPTDKDALFTVTSATAADTNGAYGTLNIALTDIEKRNPIGSDPEVCAFRYDSLSKIGNAAIKSNGDIRFLPNTNDLRVAYVTVNGREYSATGAGDSSVSRDAARVTFSNKPFTATDGSGNTLRLSGFIPMRRDRAPSGC
jgi:hypothetical protein